MEKKTQSGGRGGYRHKKREKGTPPLPALVREAKIGGGWGKTSVDASTARAACHVDWGTGGCRAEARRGGVRGRGGDGWGDPRGGSLVRIRIRIRIRIRGLVEVALRGGGG